MKQNLELKEIPIQKIKGNPLQPREYFDREKIKELAESIKEVGLINPITIRKGDNGSYEVVAGERRLKASEVAKLKTIPALIKEYKTEGDVAVESLIENIHREDLDPFEKAKFMRRIKEIENIKTDKKLADRIGLKVATLTTALQYLQVDEEVRKKVSMETLGERQARAISLIKDKEEQRRVAKISEGKGVIETEKIVSLTKKAPEEVKEALLSDEIEVEQAERISKLKTPQQRERAITEHKSLSMIGRGVERNIENQMTAREQREFDKRLLQSGNWIQSFRGSVTDSRSQLQKTIKILLLATKFIPVMDDKQKERLEYDLIRFIETLEQAKQLSEQIQEKIE